ncbi:CPBP family intramembrane glutamic endopeptidase [Clostridium algidicarnis]|uniref:CPBP family intramembrane glutamic endopeptidase n=1 Tax=Clostridium algidicarnis TaxID=37659 RepID=UPI001C0B4509|nr:type II CAAX endopeptidase family protein [Clostridium algidicarnis]MBU3204871.1 CPBP family intramembrane metalloprotease [Clostridium algidicarnis]MBU3213025.1 CPBP family intramembrane metalloprotease [Clostridium algidicarnis]MBU3223682.1 CPBP family intramembrane metalloprotease [Clostridium algidicarnis]
MKIIKQYLNGSIESKPMDFISSVSLCILQFILMVILNIVSSSIIGLFIGEQWTYLFSKIITNIIVIILLLKIYFKPNSDDKRSVDVNYTRSITLSCLLMILLLTISFRLITLVSFNPIMNYLASKSKMLHYIKEIASQTNPYLLVLEITLIGPIIEEILFRGIILNGLLKKYSPAKAILFSSLLFSLIHGNLPQMFNALFFGILLGLIYIKTKSLYAVIFTHIIANTLSIILSALEEYMPILGNPLLLILLGLLLLAVFIILYRKNPLSMEGKAT